MSPFFCFNNSVFGIYGSDIETISKTNRVLSAGQLAYFQSLFGLQTFIETDTYAGDTTAEASQVFKEVHSIAIFEPLYKENVSDMAPFFKRIALSKNLSVCP